VQLSVTPTITTDKKYVILNISAYRNELLELEPAIAEAVFEGEIVTNTFEIPTTEFTILTTRVMIPDRSTILLGGQTVAGETQLESGVPILKSIPFFGRLFTNKSEVKDKQVLLILVKPTILLKNEQEQAATAALRQ
jgi:type II secretory pathway component GspD/PulD (secretin)